MTTDNAIQQALARLDDQWEDFISSKLPMLRWYFSPDDIPLGLTFIKVKEQLDENNPELFIHLHSEFENPDDFGRAIAEEMNQLIEEGIADAMLEEDQEQSEPVTIHQWAKPDLQDCTTGFNCIFRSCQRVLESFGDYVHNVVLVITPTRIKSSASYTRWWETCCDIHARYQWPDNLRLVVFDTDKHSALATLAENNRQHVFNAAAHVNMAEAMQDILNQANDGSAGANFRQQLVDLQQAVGKQNKSGIEKYSAAAIAIAQEQHWLDMWAVVMLTRAAGYLGMQSYDAALSDYRNAQQIAANGDEQGVPGCNKLQLQATMCEGTCLYSAERFDEAAIAYRSAATIAEQQNDLFMTLEGWRMTSFCLERLKQRQPALECALKALDAGRRMDEEQREQSTLPFLGQAMLRLSPNGDIDNQIKQSFTELLGNDWLANAEAMTC